MIIDDVIVLHEQVHLHPKRPGTMANETGHIAANGELEHDIRPYRQIWCLNYRVAYVIKCGMFEDFLWNFQSDTISSGLLRGR